MNERSSLASCADSMRALAERVKLGRRWQAFHPARAASWSFLVWRAVGCCMNDAVYFKLFLGNEVGEMVLLVEYVLFRGK